MNTKPLFDQEEDILVEDDTMLGFESKLIVYNDDHNSFDWVIQCFVEVCQHSQEQSEQLSLLIHFKGKATIKTGDFDTLKPMKDALVDRGLSAIIETVLAE
ncbi:MAG: ATP-dependent Clp protease adaptor ClpS [Saprospiraceae bacterium]